MIVLPLRVAVPSVGAVDDTNSKSASLPSGSRSLAMTSIDVTVPTSTVNVSMTASGGRFVTSGSRTDTMIDADAVRSRSLVTS